MGNLKASHSDHKIPSGSIVEVFGNVFLKGVDARKYRLEYGSSHGGLPTYQFFKPQGRRPITRHFAHDVERCFRTVGHGDLNRIELAQD